MQEGETDGRTDGDAWQRRPVVGRRRAVSLQQKRAVVITPVRLPDKQQPRHVTCTSAGLSPLAGVDDRHSEFLVQVTST